MEPGQCYGKRKWIGVRLIVCKVIGIEDELHLVVVSNYVTSRNEVLEMNEFTVLYRNSASPSRVAVWGSLKADAITVECRVGKVTIFFVH